MLVDNSKFAYFLTVSLFVSKELAREKLLLELTREHAMAVTRDSQAKETSLSAAAMGASVGAGLGVLLAVVLGAASALRKP